MPQRRGLGRDGQEPVGAAASRGWARQPGPCQRAVVANRYLPVVGHTDGTLSVLELRSLKTVFRTEAHSPGPVTAIASTWNSIVSSGRYLSPLPRHAGRGLLPSPEAPLWLLPAQAET